MREINGRKKNNYGLKLLSLTNDLFANYKYQTVTYVPLLQYQKHLITRTSFNTSSFQICVIGEITGGNELEVMMHGQFCLLWFSPAVVIINWALISTALELPQWALITLIIHHRL